MNDTTQAVTGNVFEIQRFCIHDGPGIRTTVFLQGCPLRCLWCHNPEGITQTPKLSFLPEKCIGCKACLTACPAQAHIATEQGHEILRENCTACGSCAETCYANALEVVGKRMSVDEVVAEVVRDRPFYETSGGGMTLSGGEPTMQLAFSLALLQGARDEGLHCAVETCGMCEYASLETLLPHTDLFLFDCKDTDSVKHKEFTGQPNERILQNLRRLHDAGARVRLRCPIVPGCNDRDDHFAGIAALAKELPNLEGVEILPYHKLGESKVARFGLDMREWSQPDSPSAQTVNDWREAFAALGVELIEQT